MGEQLYIFHDEFHMLILWEDITAKLQLQQYSVGLLQVGLKFHVTTDITLIGISNVLKLPLVYK